MAQLTDSIVISRGGVIGKTTLNDLPVSSATLEAIDNVLNDGSVTEASTVNTGCLNVNPYFELADADYSSYATLNGTGSRIITPKASHNTRYGLQIKNAGGTLIGTKTLPAITDIELRATIGYRFRVFGDSIDPAKSYSFRMYFGTKCYDANNNFISHENVYTRPNTETTLASQVNDGDTTILINTPATAWASGNGDGATHYKSFRLYMADSHGNQVYTDPNTGIIYTDHGYSRWLGYNSNGYKNTVDNGDGTTTVNLQQPWSLGAFDVGDAIVNCQGGGTYQYWTYGDSPNHPNPSTGSDWSPWYTLQGAWELLDGNTLSSSTKFRLGSAYARLMLLPNYRLYQNNVIVGLSTGQMEYEVQYSRLALEWRHQP